jgi:pimeloyl-ACP methyl ester carboxylesterase
VPETPVPTRHRNALVEGTEVFYREAGNPARPTIVLLPGHPSSSHAYTGLIERLAGTWHVLAPDYPGYGFSPVPAVTPTFDRLAEVTIGFLEQLGVERYVLYMFDFGAPVGMRMATSFPERIAGLVSQNGNIALEGLGDPLGPLAEWWGDREAHQATVDQFLSAESTRMQWAAGLRDDDSLDPAPVALDVALLADPARRAIAEALLWDYQTNPGLYPAWQAWLSEHRPPTLAIWGARDPFFTPAGAEAYRSANPEAEVVLLDTGHFALVEELDAIANSVHDLLTRSYT